MQHLDDGFEPELAPELMGALEQIGAPRETLEEEVVAALRVQGVFPPARRLRTHAWPASKSKAWRGWLLGAAAAGLAFTLGVRSGAQFAAGRSEPGAVAKGAGSDSSTAVLLREAASQYIAALNLVQPDDRAAAAAAEETLRIAADQIIRLAPESNLSFALQIAFPASYAATPAMIATVAAVSNSPRIIYF